jgi:hypothetical protein
MRLTLRTLLAYMDDILDPSDQEELGRKIEASPFATELIHRSRDAVRRLRLSAPDVLAGDSEDLHEGDPNLDANTAAEYLDNTLSPDEVAEFERSCLEAGPHADMLLAEAASCHHILTLVLGEPAEVDADLRQRMYGLVKYSTPQQVRIEPAHGAPHAQATPQPAPLAAPVVARPSDADEASVPDYMMEAVRAHRRKQRQLIAMMVGAALLGGVAAFFLWPQPEPKLPSALASGKMGSVEDLTDGVEIGGAPTTNPSTTENTEAAPPFVATPTSPEAPVADTTTPPTAGPGATDTAAAPVAAGPVLPQPGDLGNAVGIPAPDGAPAAPGANGAAGTVADPTAGAATGPATTPGADAPALAGGTLSPPVVPGPGPATGGPAIPGAVNPNDSPAAGGLLADAGAAPLPPAMTDADIAAGADAVVPPTDVQPDAPRTLGVYLGLNNDLVLRYDASTNAWVRLPPRSTFTAGAQLMVLPTFRTLAVLGADVNAFLGGGTAVVLRAPEGGVAADVALELPYGRVIFNSGGNGNRVTLVMGDQTRVIKLAKTSSLAVEVRRAFVPGGDPTKNAAPMEISWYLTTGKAEWGDGASGDAESHSAEGPATWATVDGADQPPRTIDQLPAWIDKEPITDVDARARDAVSETLVASQPVNVPLLELTGTTGLGRRTEVRALAALSGAYVGEFEPLVKALADPNERAKRDEQVQALRDAIARNPGAVKQIHDAFALQRGEQAADDLTEMVIGFNPDSIGKTREELKNGSLVRLIHWLDDEDLTYRVLASYNLNEITGTSYLGGYRPEHPASKRSREIVYYTQRLDKGELTPAAWTPTGWAKR